MSKPQLSNRDQLFFAIGLACMVTAIGIGTLFSDVVSVWLRFIQDVFLLAGIGFLAMYVAKVSRKL